MTKKEKIIYSFISNIIDDENPENIHLLTSTDISNLIKRIEKSLLGVVEASNGTANNIYDRNIRIAGKTGTAQVKSIIETEYELLRVDKSLRDHALFVGYGPVEEPKLVVVAIIENGESGSAVAAPLVRKAINLYSKK